MTPGIHIISTSKDGRLRMCVEVFNVDGKKKTRTFHQMKIGENWVAKAINYMTDAKNKATLEKFKEVHAKHFGKETV